MAENISTREALESRTEAPKAGATFPDILKHNKFVKYAVAAVLAGSLSSCATEGYEDESQYDVPAESKEVQSTVPRMEFARDVEDARLYSMDILNSDKIYSITVTETDNPGNSVVVNVDKKEGFQTLDVTFDVPTYKFNVQAHNENGQEVEINKTKKPGTIFGSSTIEFTEGINPDLGETPSE